MNKKQKMKLEVEKIKAKKEKKDRKDRKKNVEVKE
jgi:hypothetical protein